MSLRPILASLSAAAFIACVPGGSLAQESRGTIGGQVTDTAGAVIAQAKVVITNIETSIATTLTTNESGSYVAPLLIPGHYRVTAEHTGFKRHSRTGITLSVNDNLQIDIKLDVGDVSTTVAVVDSAPLVETADGSLGQIIGAKELTELPIAHGNPYALIALAPGTTFEGDQKLNRPYEPTHIVDYSMSGSVSGTTDITLDGVSNTSKGSNGRVAAGYVPPVDAIGEVRIQTSSFDARTGQTSGGVVNISLRSGTNKLHGSATFTKMKPQWMANDFFANRAGIARGDFNYNRWSTSVAGPVVIPKLYNGHNKTFFMWAYEGLSDRRPRGGSANLTVPTAEMRKGDFSELLRIAGNYQIYNPFSRQRAPDSTTRFQQDPFPGNVIPASLLNQVALKALDFVPPPINGGTTVDHRNNFPVPNLIETAEYFTHTFRVDHNVSPKQRLFVRANMYVRNTSRNDHFESRATGLRERYDPRGLSIDELYTFSPALVLNLRYGYTRFTRRTTPLRGYDFDLTTLGFPKSLNDAIGAELREFPVFEINGFFNTVRVGEARFMDTHSVVAALTNLRRRHTLDYGFEARAYRQSRYNGNGDRSGRYIFDQAWTRGPLDNSPNAPFGQGLASFLLGLPTANSLITRQGDMAEQSTVWAGYFGDNWRVNRKLTVYLGVRYEVEGPLTERYNRSIRDFALDTALPIEAQARAAYAASYAANPTPELPPDQFKVRGGLLFAGENGQPRELWVRDKNNIMPRISLAYAFPKSTVFRAGYGLYFGGLGLRRTDVLQNGYNRNTNMVPTRDSGLSFSATLSNPFPDGILEPAGSTLGLMTDVGSNNIEFFLPNPIASYNQRWQGSVQKQIGRNNVIEAAYVGNRSTGAEIDRDLNIVGNSLLSRSPVFDQDRVNYLSANIPNPFRGIPGVSGTLGTGANITRENLLKPFRHFSQVLTTTYQGYAWYHSLQLRGTRRFSKALQFNGSYTWAKNMQAAAYLNPADAVPYESLSGADRKHRVTASMFYELPFGRRRQLLAGVPRAVNAVIGGWQLAMIYIFQSGAPLSWQDAIFTGNADDIKAGVRTIGQWFNTNAGFSRNTATRPSYHYRTWPFRFSDVRGPAMNNWDLSINKKWKLTESGAELQARGEALNAFNRTHFNLPNLDQFSTAFGQITTTSNYARQIQATFRLNF
ncbi:MAG: carboxypeptidase regulatory-like domain-containing protein [Bryobacteraceae bacterium]